LLAQIAGGPFFGKVMVKILHLIPTLEGGGAERQLIMLAMEQVGRGQSVHIGIRRGGIYEELVRVKGVHVHILGDRKGPSLRLARKINYLIKTIQPTIVQTWLPQMDVLGGLAALWNAVPWIVSERSSELAYKDFSLIAKARDVVVRYADTIVANSAGGAAYWRGKLPRSTPVHRVANVVDVTAVRDAAPANIALPPSNHPVSELLVVGRFTSTKAHDIVVQAVRLLPPSTAVHVFMIGEGPMRQPIEALVRNYGLGDRITVLPYKADWWGLLRNAAALVSVSRYEGQPNVVLESMAGRCPVIASDIPAHREFLDHHSAMIVPSDNPTLLADAILSVLADPCSARQRAECAFQIVEAMTGEAAARAYEQIYTRLFGNRYQ
jgi:glycosyltransferase involved in cell wall biosynthesis